MNYYPHHIGDFRSGTVNMSRHARWIYRDMLDTYYDQERPLPLDLDALCDSIGVESEEERRIVERHLRFKFVKTDAGYVHERCEKEIAAYHQKASTARANGSLGGRPRKPSAPEQKPSGLAAGSDQDAGGIQGQTGLKANQEPGTNNQEEKSKSSAQDAPPADASSGSAPGAAAGQSEKTKKRRASKGDEPARVAAAAVVMPLPDCLPRDSWERWVGYRLAKGRSSVTVDAVAVWIEKLVKLNAEGHRPEDVINKSVESGWSGLIRSDAPMPPTPGARPATATERRSDWTNRLNAVLDAAQRPETVDLGVFDAVGNPV